MSLETFKFLPGIYSESTDEDASGRWKYGLNVRFWKGYPEKRGGSQKEGPNTFLGVCRGLFQWVTLTKKKYVALGTHLKFYIWEGGTYSDITPYRETGSLLNKISTTNLSPVVNINDTGHGLATGDTAHITGGTFPFNNITLNGEYIVTVVDADNYTVTAGTNASATGGPGGGTINYSYEITIGESSSSLLFGWGASTWGTPRAGGLGWNTPAATTTVASIPRTWAISNWGEDLIFNYRGGPIFVWDSSTGTGTRGTKITGAPDTAKYILVSPEDRHLIAGGAYDGAADDPLLIRWSAQEDYTDFVPTFTNDAGDKRLDVGNEIMTMIRAGTEILILTDEGAVGMSFVGLPDVFAFKTLGESCGVISPHAAAEVNGVVYWRGRDGFFMYDGVVRDLPCDVHRDVFENFNSQQKDKVYASVVTQFKEIWWIYPSSDASENDSIVVYNYQDKIWWTGTVARTAMIDKGEVVSTPFAASTDGSLYNHETGADDGSVAIETDLQSYNFQIGGGEQFMFVNRVVPNFKRLIGSVDFYVSAYKYPQDQDENVVTKGPYPVTSTTRKFHPRSRGRELSLRIRSLAQGVQYRMGNPGIDVQSDGDR